MHRVAGRMGAPARGHGTNMAFLLRLPLLLIELLMRRLFRREEPWLAERV